MSFRDEMRREAETWLIEQRRDFREIMETAKESIVEGSPLTGSQGQPVRTGRLKGSFKLSFESPDVAAIESDVDYAAAVEDNDAADYETGGPHAMKLTILGFDNIVTAVKGP